MLDRLPSDAAVRRFFLASTAGLLLVVIAFSIITDKQRNEYDTRFFSRLHKIRFNGIVCRKRVFHNDYGVLVILPFRGISRHDTLIQHYDHAYLAQKHDTLYLITGNISRFSRRDTVAVKLGDRRISHLRSGQETDHAVLQPPDDAFMLAGMDAMLK